VSDDAKVTAEVEALKVRLDENDRRFDKIDMNIQRMWEKIDSHREESIKTQTMVERLGKDLTESRMDNRTLFERMNEKLDKLSSKFTESETKHISKWEGIWAKVAWALIGILGAIVLYKIGLLK
jgi:uncharacterized coiled-coil protein SlyX